MRLHCTVNTTARATARSFTIKMEIAKHSKRLQLSQSQLKLQLSKNEKFVSRNNDEDTNTSTFLVGHA